jgi:PP-loop family
VATAHSEDDQAETVFMRLLRGSGVRGLAGLLAPGPILRPVLSLSRPTLRAMVDSQAVPFLDDPSNQDRRHLRNRVRLELLPAVARDLPWFRDWLLALGRSAAEWRHDVREAVDRFWTPELLDSERIRVPADRRRLPTRDEAALFWPEVAGRVGVALDRRGTARLASFTTSGESGRWMPLAGGAVVQSSREGWTLRRPDASATGRRPADRLAPSAP